MDLGALRRFLPGGWSRPVSDGTSAAASGASSVERPAVPAWRRLPGLAPTVGPAPLVARSRGYERELAGGRGTPLALQRLGHDRGLDAPAGLIAGVAAPVERVPDDPVPTSVRIGRRRTTNAVVTKVPARASLASVADAAGSAESDAERSMQAEVAEHPVDAPTLPDVSAAVARAPETGSSTLRTVPAFDAGASLVRAPQVTQPPMGFVGDRAIAVERTATDDASDRPPGVSNEDLPAGRGTAAEAGPAVARARADRARADAAASTETAANPDSRSRIASPGQADAFSTGGLRGTDAAPAGLAPPSSAALPPVARGGGSVRRMRLAAPIDPATRSMGAAQPASIARSIGPTTTPGPVSGDTPTGSVPESITAPVHLDPTRASTVVTVGPGSSRSAVEPEPEDAAPAFVHAAVPIRPVSVARDAAPLVGSLRPAIDLGSPAVAVRPSLETPPADAAEEPGTPTAALAALARFDPFGSVAPAAELAAGTSPFPADSPVPGAVASGRTAGALGATVTRSPSNDVTGAMGHHSSARTPWSSGSQPVGVSRSAATEPGPSPRGSGEPRRVLDTGAGAPASLPPAFGGRPTVLRPAPAGRATRSAPADGEAMTPAVPPRGAAPSTLGSSSPASELSTGLRISSWSADGIDPEPKSLTVAPSSMPSIAALQRSPDDGASRAGTILLSRPLQRADEAAAPTEAAAAQAAAGGGSAAGASAGTGPSARELDELAKKLYEPLRRRLHRELLVDRERDGSLLSLGR